jgi:hypothetical protein
MKQLKAKNHKTWEELIDFLKYENWVCDSPGWWFCPSFHPEIAIQRIKTSFGIMVRIHNNPDGTAMAHGYLDEVLVEPRHVMDILNMIYEVKVSPTKERENE